MRECVKHVAIGAFIVWEYAAHMEVDFISSLENKDCNLALKRIVPKIDMSRIYSVIEDIPYVSDLQKEFYITMLNARKKQILDFSLNML